MNAKEFKKSCEEKIKSIVNEFETETGLNIHYIDVTSNQSVGFYNVKDKKVSIKLKEE
jgi:hypothetical protein